MRGWWLLLCLPFILTACTPQITVRDLSATAVVRGCWPGSTLPPPPVTVMPIGNPTPTPPEFTPLVGLPTLTPLPTTTPYVQCPPALGETLTPWPTPLPPKPPFPTQAAFKRPSTSILDTIMQLPDAILRLDTATHPLTGEPVVAAIASPLITDGTPHVYVRVRHDQTWGDVQNVDIGEAVLYKHRFLSVAVTVDGSGAVTVVWGATRAPTIGLWSSTSRDQGETWSTPTLIALNVYGVIDITSSLDGRVFVVALIRDPLRPVLIERSSAGEWATAKAIPFPSAWYGSSGGIALVDADTLDARIVVVLTGGQEARGSVYLASRVLNGDGWQVQERRVAVGSGEGLLGRVQIATASTDTAGAAIVAATFAFFDAPYLYTVASVDSGRTWTDIAQITTAATNSAPYGTLAVDAAARRLVLVWTCCEDAQWGGKAATHYAAWSRPEHLMWQPNDPPVPIISGAVSAADTRFAQAPNATFAWITWVEQGNSVVARAVDLNRMIPESQYPQPTPFTRPTAQVQP